MKKYILSSLTITFLLLSITACSQGKQISGSSNYITKNIKVGSFDQIKSMSSSDIVYTQKQGAPTVQIYGPDNIVELMETSVSGRTLTIKFKKNTSIRNSGKLEIRVSSPSLKHLSIYGSGNTTFTNGIKAMMNCKCLSMARETSAETVSHAQNWQHVFTVQEMST